MDTWLLVPGVVLTLAALVAPRLTARLHPATAARLLTVVGSAAASTAGAWVLFVVTGLAIGAGPHGGQHSTVGRFIVSHDPIPGGMGILVVLWLAIAAGRLAHAHRVTIGVRRAAPGSGGVVVADASGFVALAIPGRHARIVISREAAEHCTPRERAVVVAHEWAHLRRHHGRYAVAMRVASITCPWLRGLDRRVAFLLERWADEEAAVAVADRSLVARTIAKLALIDRSPTRSLAFAQSDTVARTRAMLAPAPASPRLADQLTVAGAGAAATGLAGSAFQLHHALAAF